MDYTCVNGTLRLKFILIVKGKYEAGSA